MLIFVLAAEQTLPGESPSWTELLCAQRQGIQSGVALRMFAAPSGWQGSIEELASEGRIAVDGGDPFPSEGRHRLICDTVVPHFDPKSLWLGVYELSGGPPGDGTVHPALSMDIRSIRTLDRFPLRDAENETCWFYPTDNGSYLGWESQRRLETLPGYVPELVGLQKPAAYRRSDLHLLWSLMADDQSLTCVGFTFQGRRIDWPLLNTLPEACSTWTSFRVDTMADQSYEEIATITIFPQGVSSMHSASSPQEPV